MFNFFIAFHLVMCYNISYETICSEADVMAESNEMYKKKTADKNNRPQFPKRAVITGGMPYGNKTLHFGHVGGVFVFADVYARFLRDRRTLSSFREQTATAPLSPRATEKPALNRASQELSVTMFREITTLRRKLSMIMTSALTCSVLPLWATPQSGTTRSPMLLSESFMRWVI